MYLVGMFFLFLLKVSSSFALAAYQKKEEETFQILYLLVFLRSGRLITNYKTEAGHPLFEKVAPLAAI